MTRTGRTITIHVGLVVCLAACCLILLAAGATSADTQQQSSAVLPALSGKVEVLSKDQTAWQPAHLGMQVFEGDQVRAFTGANAELRLPDTSTVFVAENSCFAVVGNLNRCELPGGEPSRVPQAISFTRSV